MTPGAALKGPSATGFTLLELIVVLAIVGIVLAVAIPSLSSALRTDPGDQAVAAVTGALADTRAIAVRSGVTARAAIVRGGAEIEIPTGRIRLESGVIVDAAADEDVIDFHPTGLASGARWRIRAPDAEPITLVVAPLDGAIRRDP